MGERKPFLLRVPEELLAELRAWAEQEMRSLNGQIEWVLRDALRRRGRETPAAGDGDENERDRDRDRDRE